MTFFVVLFLLLMQFLWRYIDELVGKGLELKIIGELLLYASSSLVPLALPLSILLSSLMTFGSMGEYYELTAIKSSGISLRRVMLPLIVLVVFISIGAFYFSDSVLPFTNLKMKSLLYDVRQQRPEVQITEGVFYNGIENISIRVSRKDPVRNMLYGLQIYDHSEHRGNVKVTIADSGQMKMTTDRRNLIVTLWSGNTYSEMEENKRKRDRRFPHQIDRFGEQQIIIEMSGFELSRTDESVFRNSYQMLNTRQLRQAVDSLRNELDIKNRDFFRSMAKTSYFKLRSPRILDKANYEPPTFFSQEPGGGSPKAIQQFSPNKVAGNGQIINPADRRPVRKVISTDTTHVKRTERTILRITDFDSLYHSYDLQNQRDIVRTALTNYNMAQYMVDNSASNLKFDTKFLKRHEIELHLKFTLPFACFIFLFIGAPLGAIIRKGGLGMPTVISTLLFIIYYIISLTGQKLVRESVLPATQGMWMSSLFLTIAGVFLTYEATNDSAILNLDTYLTWIREKLGLRKNYLLEKKAHLTGKFQLIDMVREEVQQEFQMLGHDAAQVLENLKRESNLRNLIVQAYTCKGSEYLIEFSVHYNSLIDRLILSNWYRIPYFAKRLAEFPVITGRVTRGLIRHDWLRLVSVFLLPVFLIRLIKTAASRHRMKRHLSRIAELSTGMVNLLNSSAMKSIPSV